ncbi:MAG: hypothetical protein F9K43_22520, partial [Bauldia sp.]
RKERRRAAVPTVALAGYTNAGKSTLLNAITGAEVSVGDRLFHRPIDRRLLIAGENLLPDLGRLPLRRGRARLPPALVIAPVGEDRRVEGGGKACLRVRRAEVVPAGADVAHGLEREGAFVDHQGIEELRHHLQQIDVENRLFEGGNQPALHPAGRVQDEIAAAHDRAPQREDALIGRLCVDRVGGAGVGGAVGERIAARELAADDLRLHVLGRAEGGRAALHVDIGGEAAVGDGRAGLHKLREGDAGERFGILLRQRAGNRHRGHGAREREGRHDDDLAAPAHLHDALQHGGIEAQRGGGVDDRDQRGLGVELPLADAARETGDLDAVPVALAAEGVGVEGLVGEGGEVGEAVEVADRRVEVDGLDGVAARHVDDVEGLRELEEVAEVRLRAGAAALQRIRAIGRASHLGEDEMIAAEDEIVGGIAGIQGEGGRRRFDGVQDKAAVEAHPLAVAQREGAGRARDRHQPVEGGVGVFVGRVVVLVENE